MPYKDDDSPPGDMNIHTKVEIDQEFFSPRSNIMQPMMMTKKVQTFEDNPMHAMLHAQKRLRSSSTD